MDRKYREEHPEETFDGGYHLYAKEKHKETGLQKILNELITQSSNLSWTTLNSPWKMSKAGISIVEEVRW